MHDDIDPLFNRVFPFNTIDSQDFSYFGCFRSLFIN